jgi:NAD(P)-dependent dehydrogenase (short-subunit alcohol dehydrogenase family)
MHIVALDVDADGLAGLERQFKTAGVLRTFVGSVSDADAVAACVELAAQPTGQIDGVVNNAGVDLSADIETTDRASWDRLHSVDLWGPALTTRCALPRLARQASIVNISSTHAIATIPNRSAYVAAKAGLVGLGRALAVELGPRGIRVNTVLPGYVRTDIWSLWLDEVANPDALLGKIAGRHPVRRLGTPDDVAGAVAFLLSDDAAFITGTSLVVDGGYTSLLEPHD